MGDIADFIMANGGGVPTDDDVLRYKPDWIDFLAKRVRTKRSLVTDKAQD